MKKFYFLCLSFITFSASAQVFRIGNMFDAKEAVWKKNQVVVVREGIIVEINPSQIPKNLAVVDLSNKWVTPAFIDAHSHLFLHDETFGKDFSAGLKSWVNQNKQRKIKLAKKRVASLARVGFVLSRDLGNQGEVNSHEIHQFKGVHIVSSGAGWVPHFGQLPPNSPKELAREYRLISDKAEFTDDMVKLYADEEPNRNYASPLMLKKMVEKAHAQKKLVAVHAILNKGIEGALSSGADTLEHGVEMSEEQFKKLAALKMIFVPTVSGALFLDNKRAKLGDDHPTTEFKRACKNIQQALKLRIPVAFGSDHYFDFPLGDYGREQIEMISALTTCGITANQALQMATYHASMTQNLLKTGLIAPDYRADFNIYEKSPELDLKRLSSPQQMFRKGEKIN